MRPDGFALESPGDSQHDYLVHRDGEVIRPELGQPFDERSIRAHRLLQSRRDFRHVDRAIEPGQLHERRNLGIAALGITDLATQLQRLRDDRLGGLKIGARHRGGMAVKLGIEPAGRIRADVLQIPRPGTQPEAVGRDGGGDWW